LNTNKAAMLEKDENKIQAEELDYLFIQASQIPNSGKGLFTAIEIYKDEIISIFKGEVLSHSEAEFRIRNAADTYFMNLLDGTILDCRNTDGFAKYANDASGFSKSDFKNNAKIIKLKNIFII
jgi:hypothetical protein